MKNVLHNKGWNSETNLVHMEPPPITLIGETYNGKLDEYFIKQKMCRDPTYSTSDLYEFKMSLFEHEKLEEF